MKDVARDVGVSPSTVSNAYNRPDQLSVGLRERVFESAKRLGYAGPNPLGRSLKRQRSDAVGVLFGNRLSYVFADPSVMQFLEGFSEAVEEAGLGLVMLPGVPLADGEMVRNAAIDGVLIHSMASDDPLVEAALSRRLPAVVVDQPEIPGVPSVSVDDIEAGRLAAEHLLGLGHESFGVISPRLALDARSGTADVERQRLATVRPVRERLEGMARAIEDAGLSWDDTTVYEGSESTLNEGKVAAISLLSARTAAPPTAIIALSDQLALGAMEAAEDLGLSLPNDLSILGFDDVPASELTSPSLTTVHQPHTEKGLMAGRRLIASLRGETETHEDLLLPTRLVVRESTAKPPRTD